MNPYAVLGITSSASEEEIKKAYRTQIRLWHPDINHSPEAEEKAKEINKAYKLLMERKPAIHWFINGEEVTVRNFEDIAREWDRKNL